MEGDKTVENEKSNKYEGKRKRVRLKIKKKERNEGRKKNRK